MVLVRQKFRQDVLRLVGVLVLVNQNVAVAFLIFFEHGGIFAKQFDGGENQVVEVKRVVFAKFFFVEFVNRSDVFAEVAALSRFQFPKVGRVNQSVFRVGDSPLKSRDFVGVEIKFAHALFEQRFGVGGVVNREVRVKLARDFDFASQKPCAEAVERA